MFSGQREFRGIVFSCSLSKISDLLGLFPRNVISKERTQIGEIQSTFEVLHCYYYSKVPYAPVEMLQEISVRIGRSTKYQYDFYVAKWQLRRTSVYILAVPFSRMAMDMFGVLEEKLHAYSRKYKKLKLDEFLVSLQELNTVSARIAATAVDFRVSGTDTVNAARMSGADVVASEFYKRTTKTLHGITIEPRRVRLRYKDEAIRFSMETNKHGSFWFRVRKGGGNLPWLVNVLSTLEIGGLLSDDNAYPLRASLVKEEKDG